MNSSRVDYLWIVIIFTSCLDSHSDGTHSLQKIHWWASDTILNFFKKNNKLLNFFKKNNKLIHTLNSQRTVSVFEGGFIILFQIC